MYENRNGHHHFVLIDFDMAVELPKDDTSSYVPSSKHRTGTLPFMAHELVADAYQASHNRAVIWVPIPHRLRHDFESLFWVSLWCILSLFRHGLSKQRLQLILGVLERFESGNLQFIASHRKDVAENPLEDFHVSMPPGTECLQRWLKAWNKVFSEARAVSQKYKYAEDSDSECEPRGTPVVYDQETMGGYFTQDSLKAALTRHMPLHQDDIEFDDQDQEDLDYLEDIAVQDSVNEPNPLPERRAQNGEAAQEALSNIGPEARVTDLHFNPQDNVVVQPKMAKTMTKPRPRTRKRAKAAVKAAPIIPHIAQDADVVNLPEDDVVQHPIKNVAKPKRQPERGGRKRKREDEVEAGLDNDIRSRLRPRRKIVNYKC